MKRKPIVAHDPCHEKFDIKKRVGAACQAVRDKFSL